MELIPHRVIGRIKLDNTEEHLVWGWHRQDLVS